MKKLILLAAVALLSLGASAQKYNVAKFGKTPVNEVFKAEMNKLVSKIDQYKPAARTATRAEEIPDGDQKEMMLVYAESLKGVDTYVNRAKIVNVIFAEDGTVYIPTMLYSQLLDDTHYLKGKLEGDKITIAGGQTVGKLKVGDAIYDTYIYKSTNTGQPLDSPIELYYSAADGVISSEPNNSQNVSTYISLYADLGEDTGLGLINGCINVQYFPTATFCKAPVTRPFTYDVAGYVENQTGASGVTTDIDAMQSLGCHIMKGLIPLYPDAWILLMGSTDNNLYIGGQVVHDEVGIFMTVGGSGKIEIDFSMAGPMVYNASTNTYAQGPFMIADCSYENESLTNYSVFTNINIGAPTPTGINNVQTSTDKEAVSVEYYDLSGRRISAAEKGVSIKVEKYADGTSKAVKVMK